MSPGFLRVSTAAASPMLSVAKRFIESLLFIRVKIDLVWRSGCSLQGNKNSVYKHLRPLVFCSHTLEIIKVAILQRYGLNCAAWRKLLSFKAAMFGRRLPRAWAMVVYGYITRPWRGSAGLLIIIEKERCALSCSKELGFRMTDVLNVDKGQEGLTTSRKKCAAPEEKMQGLHSSVREEICLLRCCFSLSNAQTSGISAASEDYSTHLNLNDQRHFILVQYSLCVFR